MRENEEFIKENLEKYGNIKIFSQFHAYLQDKKQQSRPPQSNYQLLPPVFEPNPDPNLEINMMLPPNPSNPMPLIQKMSQNSYYQDPKGPYPPSKPRFMGYNRPPLPMGSMPYPAQYTPETSNKPPYYYNNNPRMNEMNPPRMNPPLNNQMNNNDINPRINQSQSNDYSPRGNPPTQMNPTMNHPPQMNPTMNPQPQTNPIMNPPPQMNTIMNPMNQPPQMNQPQPHMNPMNQPPQMNPTMNQQIMNQPPQMEKRQMNYYDKYQQQQPAPPYGTGGAYYPQEINNHVNNPNMGYYQHHQDRSFSAPKLSQPTFWSEESKNLQHGTPYENYTNMPKPPINYLKPTNNYSGYFPTQPTPPNDNIGTMGGQNQSTNSSMNNMGYYNNNPNNNNMRILTNNNNPINNNNNNNNNNQRQNMPNINPYIKPGYSNNNEMPPQNLPFSSNIFPMKQNTNPAQNPSNMANFYDNSSNFINKIHIKSLYILRK